MWVLPAPRTLEYRFGLAADRRNARYWIVTGLAFTVAPPARLHQLVLLDSDRVTELRVTIVVALGLAAVALWLSAAWLLIVRVIR